MIVALLGPTASGKSSLAEELAAEFPFVIVNADPFQTYRGMEILSSAPSKEDLAKADHRLYLFQDVDVPYDVVSYQADARREIAAVKALGKIPFFVGGSGLYLRSALFEYEFPKAVKKIDMSPYSALSDGDLHAKLSELDPVESKKIHPNNRVRVLRAIEIVLMTGKRKSDLFPSRPKPIEETLFLYLKPDRETTRRKIDERLDGMIEAGLVSEVDSLVRHYGYGAPGLKAIGAKELFPYFRGEKPLEECLLDIRTHTHQYVKRQETFFAHQFTTTKISSKEEAEDAIKAFLSK